MGTATPKVGFYKPTVTPPETAWSGPLASGFDEADARLTRSGSGSPQGTIPGHWVGQQYFDVSINQFWVCTNATKIASSSTWILPVAITQATYNILLPVGTCINKRGANAGVAPPVPAGVSASWVRHGFEGFLKSSGLAAPGAGGSNTGGYTYNAGHHEHNVNLDVPYATTLIGDINIGPGQPLGVVTSVGDVNGPSWGAGEHGHLLDLSFLGVVVWERVG